MRTLLLSALVVTAVACTTETHPEFHPVSVSNVSQNVSYPTTIFQSGSQTPLAGASEGRPYAEAGPLGRSDASRVLVLQSTHLDRPAEVVGVVDAHEAMGQHEAALDLLKRRASLLGADAVVGVEFHHGESEGEPTHLSGLAVRFVRSVPYPVGE